VSVETVEFDQSVTDLESFQRHHIRRGRYRWVGIGLFLVMTGSAMLVGLLAVMMALLGETDAASLIAGMATFIFVVGAMMFAWRWFVTPWIASQFAITNQQQRTMLIGPRGIAISPEGVAWRYPAGESGVAWAAVDRVERDKDGVYIYFGPRNAVWLPRRVFSSEAEFNRIGDITQDYLQESRAAASAPATESTVRA
jgi:hypothetical protein